LELVLCTYFTQAQVLAVVVTVIKADETAIAKRCSKMDITQEQIFKILEDSNCEKNLHSCMRCVMTHFKGHANPNFVVEHIKVWLNLCYNSL
jgi:hypothetical protein